MTTTVLIVKTSDVQIQNIILSRLKSKNLGRWIDLDLSLKNRSFSLDAYPNIIARDWYCRGDDNEFYYDLFSKSSGVIVLIQNYNYPLSKAFFRKWGISPQYLVNDEVKNYYFVRYKKVLREYYFAGGRELVYFDGNASWLTTLNVWLSGRHSPQEVLWSLGHENERRGNINKKNALPRKAFDWRVTSSQWQKSLNLILWRSRWWQKTKKYSARDWSFNFSRIISNKVNSAAAKG